MATAADGKGLTLTLHLGKRKQSEAAPPPSALPVDDSQTESDHDDAVGIAAAEPQLVPTEWLVKPLSFKQSAFRHASKRQHANRGSFANLKQILGKDQQRPGHGPTYQSIAAPPSLVPPKRYCDLTGHHAAYTDPMTRLRFASAVEAAVLPTLADATVHGLLGLRNATLPGMR